MHCLLFDSHERSNIDLTSERTLPDLFFNTDATRYWTLLIWLWFTLIVAWKVLTCFSARIYASSTNFGLTNANSCWYTKVGMKKVNIRDFLFVPNTLPLQPLRALILPNICFFTYVNFFIFNSNITILKVVTYSKGVVTNFTLHMAWE